ncbi:hypothetical protein BJX68DRAFT_250746 [Aspergillus pseudodeflectus]|uniref:Secreted protein n=1 Tax=Aspergillus pseudodeflectus TaxID=176178 RepID=A0ABR4J8M3_9EURO
MHVSVSLFSPFSTVFCCCFFVIMHVLSGIPSKRLPSVDLSSLSKLHSKRQLLFRIYFSFHFSNFCTKCMFYVPGSLPVGVTSYTRQSGWQQLSS